MAASGGGPRGAGESGAEVGPVIRPSGARRPARKFTRANHFNGLPALLRNFLRPWFCFADPAPSPVLIWPKTFRAGIGVTEFALSIFLPKGPQPTTCHLRVHFELWLAAPFPSHSQLPTRLLQTRRFRPGLATGRDVSLLASTEPKRSAHFARRNETLRGSHRKSLKSLWAANQRFRGIVCFQGLESVLVSPFSHGYSFQGLSSTPVSPRRRPELELWKGHVESRLGSHESLPCLDAKVPTRPSPGQV
jgi:hypothetical protein